jgi:hypothetical protein
MKKEACRITTLYLSINSPNFTFQLLDLFPTDAIIGLSSITLFNFLHSVTVTWKKKWIYVVFPATFHPNLRLAIHERPPPLVLFKSLLLILTVTLQCYTNCCSWHVKNKQTNKQAEIEVIIRVCHVAIVRVVFWSFHCSVMWDSRYLGYDTALLGKWPLIFQRNVPPSSPRVQGNSSWNLKPMFLWYVTNYLPNDAVSYPRWPESSTVWVIATHPFGAPLACYNRLYKHLLQIQVFWNAMPSLGLFFLMFWWNILPSSLRAEGSNRVQEFFSEPSRTEDADSTFLRQVRKHQPTDTASHPDDVLPKKPLCVIWGVWSCFSLQHWIC